MKDFKIIDISWPIKPGMTEYKDQAKVKFIPTKVFGKNSACEHDIVLTTHTGTHVDAPGHFLPEGAKLDEFDLQNLVGPCVVFDLTHVQEKISQTDLVGLPIKSGEIVLFKTKNSFLDNNAKASTNFIYLDASAAQFLVSKKVKAVGIDYLGIEREQPGHETHKALLNAKILIIEGLRLKDVQSDNYFLCCLPLKLNGLEAAPARAVLLKS
jgi:arylformamidase